MAATVALPAFPAIGNHRKCQEMTDIAPPWRTRLGNGKGSAEPILSVSVAAGFKNLGHLIQLQAFPGLPGLGGSKDDAFHGLALPIFFPNDLTKPEITKTWDPQQSFVLILDLFS